MPLLTKADYELLDEVAREVHTDHRTALRAALNMYLSNVRQQQPGKADQDKQARVRGTKKFQQSLGAEERRKRTSAAAKARWSKKAPKE